MYTHGAVVEASDAGQAAVTPASAPESSSLIASESVSSSLSTPSPTSTSAQSASASPSPPPPGKSSSHTGAIVGGVVGGVAALALIGLAVLLLLRRRKNHANHTTLPPGVAEGEQKYEQYSHVSSPPPAVFAPARQYDPYQASPGAAPAAEVAGSSPLYGNNGPEKTTYAHTAPTFGGELPTNTNTATGATFGGELPASPQR
jgi:hypothetical protein